MASVLKPEQVQELRKVFGTFDNGNTGHLESRELGACFRCFGYVATEADMQEIVNEVGGTVDFQQFCHVSSNSLSSPLDPSCSYHAQMKKQLCKS